MNSVTLYFFKNSIRASQQQACAQNHLLGQVGTFICNALIMITFPQRGAADRIFQEAVQQGIETTQHLERLTFKADLWRSVFSWTLLMGMIIFLTLGWEKSWISLGDFSFIGAVCFYVRRAVWMTSFQLLELFKEWGIIQEALTLILQPTQACPISQLDNTPIFESTALGLNEVQFGYTPDKILFNHLNISIPAGLHVAIAGDSGIGKTSLIYLLLRLYDPQAGIITLNERAIRTLPLPYLRNHFSYVPQHASFFHRSIFENIAIGNPHALPQDIYNAAKICLCHEFISSLPMGYNTMIGEGGYTLSGGQQQRIALARAYLKKASIFILDEATSGLDARLEAQLLDNLCTHLKLHTLIVISHHPAVLAKIKNVIYMSVDNLHQISASQNF
jgi:ATP-binding cassette subfamily B protein